MNKIVVLLGIIVSLCFAQPEHNIEDAVVQFILNQQYTEAHRLVENVLKSSPHNIDANYMKVSIDATILMDYESYSVAGMSVLPLVLATIRKIERVLESAPEDDRERYTFYLGNCYSIKGLIQMKNGQWVDGLKAARQGVRLLEGIIKKNPQYKDAYLTVGMYDYYLGKELKWVPFMGKKRARGLKQIQVAVSSKSSFSFGAKKAYVEILLEQKKGKEALSIVESMLKSSPQNTILQVLKIRAHYLMGHYDDVIDRGKKLINQSLNRKPPNWTDIMSTYYLVISSCKYVGRKREGKNYIEKVKNSNIPEEMYKISYVKEYKEASLNMLEEF